MPGLFRFRDFPASSAFFYLWKLLYDQVGAYSRLPTATYRALSQLGLRVASLGRVRLLVLVHLSRFNINPY